MLAVARGTLKVEEARAAIQQATRNYAKRQMTWFRKDAGIRWFAGAGDKIAIQDEIRDWVGAAGWCWRSRIENICAKRGRLLLVHSQNPHPQKSDGRARQNRKPENQEPKPRT